MAQKGFGRRQAASRSGAARPATPRQSAQALPAENGGDPLATSPGAATRRSFAVLAGIAGVVTIAAGGLAFALNAASAPDSGSRSGDSTPTSVRSACRANQPGCTNQYQVALSCGSQQEPKSVRVHAPSPDVAEAKAQRYNQGCRSRGASFVASVMKSAALSYYGGSRAGESRTADSERPRRRYTFRFRRR